MAEILVRWKDGPGRVSYRKGDAVLVMPDGHQWGRAETLPPAQGGGFVIVSVQMTKEQAERLVELDSSRFVPGAPPHRKRRYALDLSRLAGRISEAEVTGRMRLPARQRGLWVTKDGGEEVL